MEYLTKIEMRPETDLTWNIPEQKTGTIKILGGNSQNFRTEIKIAEFLLERYPLKQVTVVLPDVLRSKLSALPNLQFLVSTESGSLADGDELKALFSGEGLNLLLGDFSKNAITCKAIFDELRKTEQLTVVTRDTVDLITEQPGLEQVLMHEQMIVMASMSQLVKLFRAIYYPRMLFLTQSLVQVAETLHKFTLSYSVKIITLHNEQILIAENGMIRAVPLEKTSYSPMTFWNGEMAAKIAALNLYNPGEFMDATVSAIFA